MIETKDVDRRKALAYALLLQFEKNIKFDYPMPEAAVLIKRMKTAVFDHGVGKLKKEFQKVLFNETWNAYDDIFMFIYDIEVFGSEWFFGFGTLRRWRAGEKEKAEKIVNENLTSEELEQIKELAAHYIYDIEVDGGVAPFTLGDM